MPTNQQEPIEKKDLDAEKKIQEAKPEEKSGAGQEAAALEKKPERESGAEKEPGAGEAQEVKVAEKIETARRAISTQPATPAHIQTDAQSVSEITEYEKKVEKLLELALEKGPMHAIKVAQHMDKGKVSAQLDNYTLDEIHDRLLEEELRNQLFQKGLLKEL